MPGWFDFMFGTILKTKNQNPQQLLFFGISMISRYRNQILNYANCRDDILELS